MFVCVCVRLIVYAYKKKTMGVSVCVCVLCTCVVGTKFVSLLWRCQVWMPLKEISVGALCVSVCEYVCV